jgi:hypothetical protein
MPSQRSSIPRASKSLSPYSKTSSLPSSPTPFKSRSPSIDSLFINPPPTMLLDDFATAMHDHEDFVAIMDQLDSEDAVAYQKFFFVIHLNRIIEDLQCTLYRQKDEAQRQLNDYFNRRSSRKVHRFITEELLTKKRGIKKPRIVSPTASESINTTLPSTNTASTSQRPLPPIPAISTFHSRPNATYIDQPCGSRFHPILLD